jgi:S1-C subfamily serine protease
MLESMRRPAACVRLGSSVCLVALGAAWAPAAVAQELPKVSATRPVAVEGITIDARVEDVLGLGRIHFQGLVAAELSAVGYRVVPPHDSSFGARALTLVGLVKEEVCSDVAPPQCRVAIQWELQDRTGLVVYRTTTRAVEQQPALEKVRRGLLQGALRSLLGRRRFALRLTEFDGFDEAAAGGELGFKRCLRPALPLPEAARSSAVSVVLVESGSNLAAGTILSSDGLIVTSASGIEPHAPLRVRFSAQQVLPAELVATEPAAGVALLRVAARTDSTCAPLRDDHAIVPGDAVFGVSSTLSEDAAVSLSRSVVQGERQQGPWPRLVVDARIAGSEGAPLLDNEGRLVAVAVRDASASSGSAAALPIAAALTALGIKAAPISDPRLRGQTSVAVPALGYVRDADDPPFVFTKRYTYGTSGGARRLRTAGFVTTGVGAAGVALSWLSFHGSADTSSSQRSKAIFWNDLSWVALGLGAAAVGASFVWPQGHEVVDARSSARRELFIGWVANGVGVRARL